VEGAKLDERLEASRARELGEAREAEGRVLEAIDLLSAANRARRDPELERRVLRLRHEAFDHLDRKVAVASEPSPEHEVPHMPGMPPAVAADALTTDALRFGIMQHGCLLVRGLVPQDRVDRLVDGIDRAFSACDAAAAGAPVSQTTPWFEPFPPATGGPIAINRRWVRDGGGVWAADSPRVMYELLETFEHSGVRRLITDYFGERPALSVNKCVLRRVPLDVVGDWHQDGAFLGRGIRSIDVWVALSHCGRDAPGIEIVPRRLEHVVDTGTQGAKFSWAVAPDMIERARADAPIARPIFEPGDALLFDHFLLHRTACDPGMTRERYAIETWFFAPSAYPTDGQIPLVF
jgi:Phytanoyl-CoA dioxygenase (PhyH)